MRRDKDPAVSKWIVSPVRYVVKDWIRHVKVGQAEVEMRWETVSSLLLTSDVEECGVRSKEDRVQVPGSHDTALSSELRGTHATGIIKWNLIGFTFISSPPRTPVINLQCRAQTPTTTTRIR